MVGVPIRPASITRRTHRSRAAESRTRLRMQGRARARARCYRADGGSSGGWSGNARDYGSASTEHISIVPAADDDGIRQRKEFPGQVPEGGKAEHDEERRRTAVPDLAQAPRRRWRARGCWRARAHNAQPPGAATGRTGRSAGEGCRRQAAGGRRRACDEGERHGVRRGGLPLTKK